MINDGESPAVLQVARMFFFENRTRFLSEIGVGGPLRLAGQVSLRYGKRVFKLTRRRIEDGVVAAVETLISEVGDVLAEAGSSSDSSRSTSSASWTSGCTTLNPLYIEDSAIGWNGVHWISSSRDSLTNLVRLSRSEGVNAAPNIDKPTYEQVNGRWGWSRRKTDLGRLALPKTSFLIK